MQKVDNTIEKQLEKLEISACESMKLDFSENSFLFMQSEEDNFTLSIWSKTNIKIEDIDDLVFIVPGDGLDIGHIQFVNVTEIQTVFEERSKVIEILGISYEDLYLYLTISLGSLLLVCVSIVIPSIIFCIKDK